MFPVVHALRHSHWFAPVVVTTGQHRDLVAPILELASIEPDVDLDVGRPGLTLNGLVSSVIERLDAFLRERYGATGAGVATRAQVRDEGFPVARARPRRHVVRGRSRTGCLPPPHSGRACRGGPSNALDVDSVSRGAQPAAHSRIAAFHLAPTTVNKESLVLEGVRDEQIYVTGNTGLDALRFAATLDLPIRRSGRRMQWSSRMPRSSSSPRTGGRTGTAASRRSQRRSAGWQACAVTSTSSCRSTRTLSSAVSSASHWPLTRTSCARSRLHMPNSRGCLARATVVITDSGGIQEEAPALGVPVLVARESTEREEGVDAGDAHARRHGPSESSPRPRESLDDPTAHIVDPAANPYGDGRAADRLVAALEYLAGVGPPPSASGLAFPAGPCSTQPDTSGASSTAVRRAGTRSLTAARSTTCGSAGDRARAAVRGAAELGADDLLGGVRGHSASARLDDRPLRPGRRALRRAPEPEEAEEDASCGCSSFPR